MKAGKIHRVPLTPAALALLGTRGAPDVPLFAISRGPTYDLLKALAPAATVHGFRSSFKDWCNENAVDNNLSEIALAHGVGTKVEQAYARSDLFERRRELMQKWSDFAT
jgi:integrase